jgi:hypothetical protein
MPVSQQDVIEDPSDVKHGWNISPVYSPWQDDIITVWDSENGPKRILVYWIL